MTEFPDVANRDASKILGEVIRTNQRAALMYSAEVRAETGFDVHRALEPRVEVG